MTIYVVFLGFILLTGAFCYSTKAPDRKNEILFLNITWIAMFLLCVLRAATVGRDIPGYEEAYLWTAEVPFGGFDSIYYENGYVLLMKICQWLQLPFQWFLVVVYFIIQTPIYYYIRKCSSNYFLSTLVYVCYMFFEFNLTGIRQALAASIVLIGYILYIRSPKYPLVKLIAVILLAATFHQSALICLLFPLVRGIRSLRNYALAVAGGTLVLFSTRGFFLQYIKEFFEKDSMKADAELYLGLNFMFTVAVAALFLLSYANLKKRRDFGTHTEVASSLALRIERTNIQLFLLGIAVVVLFGSDTGARSYMMFSQVIIVQLPNALSHWKPSDKQMMFSVITVFLLVFFFTNTLLPNNFDIVPYRFFWE